MIERTIRRIKVATIEDPSPNFPVVALCAGDWAVHRRLFGPEHGWAFDNAWWTITYIPAGMAIDFHCDREEAMIALETLPRITPVNFEDACQDTNSPEFRDGCKTIVAGLRDAGLSRTHWLT